MAIPLLHFWLVADDVFPYAGWLYASLNFQAISPDGQTLRTVELTLGMVGPASLGRQVQNNLHKLKNVPTAKGWDHQLHNEPALILSIEHRHRLLRRPYPSQRRGSDPDPHPERLLFRQQPGAGRGPQPVLF